MNWLERVWPFLRPRGPTEAAAEVQTASTAVTAPDPHWEAVADDDGLMWRVRWSEPDDDGTRYLWVDIWRSETPSS